MDKVPHSILKSKTSPVLKDDKYETVINFLKHPSSSKDKHFRHWVKSKQFQMMDLPGLGIKDAVVVPGKGIKSLAFIDMRHSPDGDLNYMGHFEDHMTKFHILFPLRDKSANEVATMIEERVLAYVGTPHIFHSDNGREFVNQLLHSLLDTWSSGNVTFVNGRPRHSQSQGLVERGNRTVAAIKNDEGFAGKMSFPWVSWLPRIMYSIKTQRKCLTS